MKELERIAVLYNEAWKRTTRLHTPAGDAAAQYYAEAERNVYALLNQ